MDFNYSKDTVAQRIRAIVERVNGAKAQDQTAASGADRHCSRGCGQGSPVL